MRNLFNVTLILILAYFWLMHTLLKNGNLKLIKFEKQ